MKKGKASRIRPRAGRRVQAFAEQTLPQAEFSSAEEEKGGPRGACHVGRFGADMQVYSQNDGPVTLLLEL